MRLRALEIFVELSQSASIRQVARAHEVKPSVISRYIESVEHFFRVDLFDRNADGIRLTEAGRLLVSHAQSIMADLRNARAVLDDLRGLERGEVTVYAGGAPAVGILIPVIAALHAQHPRIRFSIELSSTTEVFAAVADGRADLGFTIFSSETNKVNISFKLPIKHYVILAPNHPFAKSDRASIEDLTEVALALPDVTYSARRRLDRIAADAGVQLTPSFVTNSLITQKELAILGAAALVLPLMCVQRELSSGILRAIPLENSDALATTLDLSCAPGRVLPFAAKKLSAALSQAMKQCEGDLSPAEMRRDG